MDTRRWIVAVVLVAALVGLLVYARGHPHHRGQQVGRGSIPSALAALAG